MSLRRTQLLRALVLAGLLIPAGALLPAQEVPAGPTESPSARPGSRMRELSPFTRVPAPQGIEVKLKGSRETPGIARGWYARTEGPISAEALVEHYATELEAREWSFGRPVAEGPVWIRTGTYRDDDDVTWHVLILAAPLLDLPGGCSITIALTQIARD